MNLTTIAVLIITACCTGIAYYIIWHPNTGKDTPTNIKVSTLKDRPKLYDDHYNTLSTIYNLQIIGTNKYLITSKCGNQTLKTTCYSHELHPNNPHQHITNTQQIWKLIRDKHNKNKPNQQQQNYKQLLQEKETLEEKYYLELHNRENNEARIIGLITQIEKGKQEIQQPNK